MRIILKLLKLLKDLKPFEIFKILKTLKLVIDINNNKCIKFILDNVNFFDSFYKNKIINIILIIRYFNKNIFFSNIYIFVNRIKNVTRIKNNILLR